MSTEKVIPFVDAAGRALSDLSLGTAAAPAAESGAARPAGVDGGATLDLAADLARLDQTIEQFVVEERRLLTAHIRLVVAARAVCLAWADNALEGRHFVALSQALADASTALTAPAPDLPRDV